MQGQSLYGSALKGIFASLGGEITLKILGVAATFITLSQLGPYQYGLWQLLLSVVAGFGIVTFPGIASMLVADVSRELGAGEKRRANGLVIKSAVVFISLSALGSIAMVLAAPFVRQISGINMVFLMQLLALSVLAVGVKQVYQLIFMSQLRFVQSQAMKALDRLSYLIGIVVFVGFFQQGMTGVAYAYVISTLTSVVLLAPYVFPILLKMLREHDHSDFHPFIGAVWIRGKWALASDTLNTGIGSLWPWVVGFFLGVEAVGVIGVAVLLLSQVSSFIPVATMLRSVLPRTAHSSERMHEWLMRSMKLSLWGHIVVGTGTFIACAFVFPIFFPQHVAALPLFAALLISLPVRAVATTAAEWFYSSRMQKELFWASSFPKALTFLLLPIFLYFGGIVGYALWYLLNADLILYMRLKVIRRATGVRIAAREFFIPDTTDVELLRRAGRMVYAKMRGSNATF